jgi:hypothetical protein
MTHGTRPLMASVWRLFRLNIKINPVLRNMAKHDMAVNISKLEVVAGEKGPHDLI